MLNITLLAVSYKAYTSRFKKMRCVGVVDDLVVLLPGKGSVDIPEVKYLRIIGACIRMGGEKVRVTIVRVI